MALQKALSLAFVHLLVFIIPGANTALIFRNTLKFGLKFGALSSLGIASAITLHAIFATLAANTLIASFSQYFWMIKVLGAFYISYFGITLVYTALRKTKCSLDNNDEENEIFHGFSAFQSGFFLDLFNPYIGLFYLSLGPSYLEDFNAYYGILIFVGMIAFLNSMWFIGLAFLVSYSKKVFFEKFNMRFLEMVTGISMCIFALLLILKS
ncbi:LysE family translocator [Parachlamydia acanthamoebae]|uniref:LysE family translocator n=1 Tax=Parachlamydia acanthamoebae TaxID=83552 RepID=UPI0007509DA4|nr:LysE family translocator [Parachlamydia acanthamoebae]